MTADQAQASGLERKDLYDYSSFRFLALTSRLGCNIKPIELGKAKIGGKIEADFYAGLTGSSGTAQMRLRQAFLTLAWDRFHEDGTVQRKIQLLVGQGWHPLAADLPPVVGLNAGVPFTPFSRPPMVKLDAQFGTWFSFTAAALWQMQHNSTGPNGKSADYIKYSCTPEVFLGLNAVTEGGLTARVGGNSLSIKPRRTGTKNGYTIEVDDRITTIIPFVFLKYKKGIFEVSAKSTFAQAGEHLSLNGGYGIKKINDDGSYDYSPTRNSSSWICFTVGKKVQGLLFAGYAKNFGVKDNLITSAVIEGKNYTEATNLYFCNTSYSNLNSMVRVTPTFLYKVKKLTFAVEYEWTAAQYGDYKIDNGVKYLPVDGVANDNLHWVSNHRVQAMLTYAF